MKQFTNIFDFQWEAGALCLDFANTVDWHASAQPTEMLTTWDDVIAWAEKLTVLDSVEGRQLRQAAADHPQRAAVALLRAHTLREVIYRIFSALAAHKSAANADLAYLNQVLQDALSHLQILVVPGSFVWTWAETEQNLDQLLWPIAYSAAHLLTSDLLDRVKECEDEQGCGFLFLDMSKNRSRRWCSMESCGNRAKVRRHRTRTRAAEP